MEQLFAVAGFLIVAAITPGPNNFVVLTSARHGGPTAALPAMLGVIGGSLVLLALVWSGAQIAFERVPSLPSILTIMGAGYVGALGAHLIRQTFRPNGVDGTHLAAGLPKTTLGLAVFQLLNPKAWALVTTATAAASHASFGFLGLAALLILICGACLSLWACAGSAIAGLLRDERSRRWFDRMMGLALIASAAMLLFGA